MLVVATLFVIGLHGQLGVGNANLVVNALPGVITMDIQNRNDMSTVTSLFLK